MKHRLCRAVDVDVNELDRVYTRLTREPGDDALYKLPESKNNDSLTFLLSPVQQLVEYENDQYDSPPRPGVPGLWSGSDSWIGR